MQARALSSDSSSDANLKIEKILDDIKLLPGIIRDQVKRKVRLDEAYISKILVIKIMPQIFTRFIVTLAHGDFLANFDSYLSTSCNDLSSTNTCLCIFTSLSKHLSTAKLCIAFFGWKRLSEIILFFRKRLQSYQKSYYLLDALYTFSLQVFTSSSAVVVAEWESKFQFTVLASQLIQDVLLFEKKHQIEFVTDTSFEFCLDTIRHICELLSYFFNNSDESFQTYRQHFFSDHLQLYLETIMFVFKYTLKQCSGQFDKTQLKTVRALRKEASSLFNVAYDVLDLLTPLSHERPKLDSTLNVIIAFFVLCLVFPKHLEAFATTEERKQLLGNAMVFVLSCDFRFFVLNYWDGHLSDQDVLPLYLKSRRPFHRVFEFLSYSKQPRAQILIKLFSNFKAEESQPKSDQTILSTFQTQLQKDILNYLGKQSCADFCCNPECPDYQVNPVKKVQGKKQAKANLFSQKIQSVDVIFSFCSACGLSRYCSQTCQKMDWPDHKIICKEHVKYHSKKGITIHSDVKKD